MCDLEPWRANRGGYNSRGSTSSCECDLSPLSLTPAVRSARHGARPAARRRALRSRRLLGKLYAERSIVRTL